VTTAYDKIKSTIDKYCGDAAIAVGNELVTGNYISVAFETADIDDVVTVDSKVKSEKALVGWGIEVVSESPRAPLYAVTFRLVFRLPSDASNSAQAKAIAGLREFFAAGTTISIGDFIDPAATGLTYGRLYMVGSAIMPAAVDGNASVREMRVEAKASCR